ncbi:MAG: hypothetical protein Q9227_005689 [Pyrenula ochraceoflavens]
MRFSYILSLVATGSFVAAQSPNPTTTGPTSSPQPTVCGDLINSSQTSFNAKQAFDCLVSVPFNADVATRFVEYYKETIQFQSTLAYLKNPPPGYQQPAVDLISGLESLQHDIQNDTFHNQYAFEVALQTLINSAHDSHLQLFSGAENDLLDPGASSPIATINGIDAIEYLTQLASSNAVGGLEAHTDWNLLMSSSALYIQSYLSVLEGGITFYPGEDITLRLENGTQIGPEPWIAFYNTQGETGPLETGGDFYNFFVLGLPPASFDDTTSTTPSAATSTAAATSDTAAASSAATATATTWPEVNDLNFAYPDDPFLAQSDLGNTRLITGYLLHENSTAVLSIPSFYAPDSVTEDDFSQTISDFLAKSVSNGMTKVLIDLQGNTGGDTFLAIDTFKQFFPNIDPFLGSRLRAQPKAQVLGNTFTQFFDDPSINEADYYRVSASDWVATDKLNANTGQNFSSWDEYFGPNEYNGDSFTTTQRYDLSNLYFDYEASGGLNGLDGYGENQTASSPPYAAENIVILSDGLCASACALFMEMMHHEVGVRTVAVGGRPYTGPMQAPGGTRGAESYTFGYPEGSAGDLDSDISTANQINASTVDPLSTQNVDWWITSVSLNLRDQIRKENPATPVQFLYEAANCRIFYTPDTIFNYSNLWAYAAAAIWSNPSLCVQGSTGFATGPSSSSPSAPQPPPQRQNINPISLPSLAGLTTFNLPASFTDALYDVVEPIKRPPPDRKTEEERLKNCIQLHGARRCGDAPSRAGRLAAPRIQRLPPKFLQAPPKRFARKPRSMGRGRGTGGKRVAGRR